MNKTKALLLLNIIIPLLVGGILYCIFAPDVIFVQIIEKILEIQIRFPAFVYDCVLIRFIRNYFLDMLWAYTLVFALFFLFGNNTASLMISLCISLIFSAGLEILQLSSIVCGTFDLMDILVEWIAETIAVVIIRFSILRRRENE